MGSGAGSRPGRILLARRWEVRHGRIDAVTHPVRLYRGVSLSLCATEPRPVAHGGVRGAAPLQERSGRRQGRGELLVKLFTTTFAIGVATGITMEFAFGTNWANYSRFVGNIFGAPLAAEGLLSFFLESTFLGVLLFGRKKVSRGFYYTATWLVAGGAFLSALWILIANSWQQTPAGYRHTRRQGGAHELLGRRPEPVHRATLLPHHRGVRRGRLLHHGRHLRLVLAQGAPRGLRPAVPGHGHQSWASSFPSPCLSWATGAPSR